MDFIDSFRPCQKHHQYRSVAQKSTALDAPAAHHLIYLAAGASVNIFRSSQFDVIVLPSNLLISAAVNSLSDNDFLRFLLLIYQGSLRKFGFIQTLIDTSFAALLVFFSGSSSSIFSSVFFFPIVAGGLILPRKGGLIAAAAATLEFGTILILESYGLYPAYISEYLTLRSHLVNGTSQQFFGAWSDFFSRCDTECLVCQASS